jgi:lipopolysaccharide/colanic/teichoic acid biosynthesis glycosyltransferase
LPLEKLALRIQHGLWYIQHGSRWLDLKILLMTPHGLLTGPEVGPDRVQRRDSTSSANQALINDW